MDPITGILQYIAGVIANLIAQVQGGLSTALNTVGGVLGSIAGRIGDAISGLVNNIAPTITSIVRGVVENVSRFFDPLFQTIFAMVERIDATIRGFLEPLLNAVGSIVRKIEQAFSDLMGSIRGFLENLWERIREVAVGVLETIYNFVQDIGSKVAVALQGVINTVKGWVESAANAVVAFIRNVTQLAADAWDAFKRAISNGIDALLKVVTSALQKTADLINAEWKKLVTGAESIIESVNDRIKGLASSFDKAAEDLGGALALMSEEHLAPLVDNVKGFVSFFKDGMDPETYQGLQNAVEGAVAPGTLNLRGSEGFARFFQTMIPKHPLGRFAFLICFGVFLPMAVFRGVTDANAQVLLQEFGKLHPYQVLSPADVIQAYRRGNAGQEKTLETIRAAGFTPEDAVLQIKNSENVPPPGDLVAYWLRGLLSEQGLDAALNVYGFREEWTARIKEAAQIIPPVSDLITMSVREVFSPETASRFGQFDEFPAEFAVWAQKQGLSEEWAKRYWAAHWNLPSATQGFEMVHREAIEEKDLDTLLKALDVMPFWREPLKKITYNTLTRVDVRRMHQLGVLSEEDVERAHRHMGYNPNDAALLTEFVVRLNKRNPGTEDEELGKLTRQSILGFYRDGLLPRQRAMQLLMESGQTPEAAALFLNAEDLDEERAERKAEAEHILELARAGTIDYAQASDRLNRLGLETTEVRKALAKLERATEKRVKIPSQDDGEKLYVGGFISQEDYAGLLDTLGYSDRWIRAYMAQANKKREDHASKSGSRVSA